MFFIFFLIILIVSKSSIAVYEESMSEMMTQCLQQEKEMFRNNRDIPHECEKDNFNSNFSYIVQTMTTRYSKQKFHCFLFLKTDSTAMRFKIWFSHKNYKLDGVSKKLKHLKIHSLLIKN